MADASDPGCTSVSWSCLGATVSLGALPVPHKPREVASASRVWDVQVVLWHLLSCHVLGVPSPAAPG